MGIVCIILPGSEQRAFVNALHEATGQGVDLVVIKKPKIRTARDRLRRIYEVVRAPHLLRELWYGALLRLSRRTRMALKYFRATSFGAIPVDYAPKTMEVEDVNSGEVVRLLEEMSPELIVIWCSAILRPPLLATTKRVINFHTGILPYYRGSVANQFAVLRRDTTHIGSTIHYVSPGVDRGDIIAQLYGDTSKSPREMFEELNDASLRTFIQIAKRVLAGEDVPGQKQNQHEGGFFRLSQWSNYLRWTVGRQLLRWERTGQF